VCSGEMGESGRSPSLERVVGKGIFRQRLLVIALIYIRTANLAKASHVRKHPGGHHEVRVFLDFFSLLILLLLFPMTLLLLFSSLLALDLISFLYLSLSISSLAPKVLCLPPPRACSSIRRCSNDEASDAPPSLRFSVNVRTNSGSSHPSPSPRCPQMPLLIQLENYLA
jgi:hypothetical protein